MLLQSSTETELDGLAVIPNQQLSTITFVVSSVVTERNDSLKNIAPVLHSVLNNRTLNKTSTHLGMTGKLIVLFGYSNPDSFYLIHLI